MQSFAGIEEPQPDDRERKAPGGVNKENMYPRREKRAAEARAGAGREGRGPERPTSRWRKWPKREAEVVELPDVDIRDGDNDWVIMNRPMADARLHPTPPDRWDL